MISRRKLTTGFAAVASVSGIPGGRAQSSRNAKAAGFYMPEETVPHERTFMQWPVNRAIHDDASFLKLLQKTIASVANTIAEFEPVAMMMPQQHQQAARKLLGAAVEIWDIPTDDLWARDSGPAFVIDGKGGLALTQFNFNGWGGKQVHASDGEIAARVAERLKLPVFDNGLVGEAGGVEQDGEGTLIAHASCWINPNRNKADKQTVEALLLEATGAGKIIWAPGVIGADITDYHIDALARFVAPGKVVIQMPERLDEEDPWSRSAFETHDILKSSTDAKGRPLQLVRLPEPVNTRTRADDFVSSYVNYYVCNGAVIAAQFGDRDADEEAASTLKALYPGREVITLNVDAIGEVGGGIHCATHEQPKA